jgi:hypothetical protein
LGQGQGAKSGNTTYAMRVTVIAGQGSSLLFSWPLLLFCINCRSLFLVRSFKLSLNNLIKQGKKLLFPV